MAAQFRGTTTVDIRDSVPDWGPSGAPKEFIKESKVIAPEKAVTVAIDVSGEPYLNLEREAQAMMMREGR